MWAGTFHGMACRVTKSEVEEVVEVEVTAAAAVDSDEDDAGPEASIDKEDTKAAPPRVAFHDAGLEYERQSFNSRT